MLSLKNKKQNGVVFALALFLFSSGAFFFSPTSVHAAGFWGWPGEAISDVFKGLLYGIFLAIGLFTSAAITMFEWAIKPENISGPTGILNSSSVYDMWKFVRDFFNLFFILTLLYTAFTIVFQVAKDYKKTLLSLVLAALFVNFSFPITRVLIDVTNVPMYYFINQIGAGKNAEEGKLGSMLSASQLKGILIPGAEKGGTATMSDITVGRLLLAIIFIFMFTVSLMVLAVMFVIRLVALIMLLIFSSVGFAASVIPGMERFGNDWWNYLSKYALFGPAAALMLFISTQFFKEISKNDTGNQFLQAGTSMVVSQDLTLVSSMAMFAIPIIMMWMAIGMASSMSIIGAGAVVGMGQSFIQKTGRAIGRSTYNNPLTRGLGAGAKDRFQGTKVGRWLKSPSGVEAGSKGWAKKTSLNPVPIWRESGKGRAGARTELQKLKDKQINEQIGKDKENKLSRTDALNRLKSGDEIMRVSGAASLAHMDNGIQNMDDLNKTLDALKDQTGKMNPAYAERALEVISKADKKIIAETTKTDPITGVATTVSGLQNLNSVVASLGDNEKAISDLIGKIDDSALTGNGADWDSLKLTLNAVNKSARAAGVPSPLVPKLKNQIIKEGAAHILVENITAGSTNPAVIQSAVDLVLDEMKSTKDMVGNVKLFELYETQAKDYVNRQNAARQTEIKKSAAQDSPEVAKRII